MPEGGCRDASHAAYRANRSALVDSMRAQGYVSALEASEMLRVGRPTLYRWIKTGALRGRTTGGRGIRGYRWVSLESIREAQEMTGLALDAEC